MSPRSGRYSIDFATLADLPEIVQIYNSTVAGGIVTADLDPVSADSRLNWFHAHTRDHHPIWVCRAGQDIAGWLSFSAYNSRPAYDKTAEVSVYIHPDFQRQHVATSLLLNALDSMVDCNLETLVALIFAANVPSMQLFSRFGFQQWGLLPSVAETRTQLHDLVVLGYKHRNTY